MQLLHTTRLLALSSLMVILLGCPSNKPGDDLANTQDDVSVSDERDSAADVSESSWYRQARTLDITGDGQPDSIQLEAVGSHPDSLLITLTIYVDGQEKHREGWESSYELALMDSAALQPSRVDSVLRDQLDRVLASVAAHRLGMPDMQIMGEDSAALAGIEPQPTYGVSFAYGYETVVRLAWDAPRQRFIRLWSCC